VPLVTAKASTRARYGAVILFAALSSYACSTFACSSGPPTLNGVVPSTGYPRQLLAVDGTTLGVSVVWDIAGAEIEMATGLFGTQYFQIPEDATAGDHMVAIRNANGTSSTATVTVLAPAPFPAPRIEDVGILAMGGAGPVDVLLTVSAANLDVNATVTVDELDGERVEARTVGPVILWGGLPIDDLQAHGHDPNTFGYPVYHYAQQLVPVEGVAIGARLHITVTNSDGMTGTFDFTMPANIADLDSDGDGLLNSWEESGYAAPSGANISLAALGTNVWRKDILVEVDHSPAVKIHDDLWQEVELAFRNAPVLNPDGSAGINIIIDRGQGGELTGGGQELPGHHCVTYADPAPTPPLGCTDLRSFYQFKRDYFNSDRRNLFHYVVWGNRWWEDIRTGESERWGNDVSLTLGPLGAPGNTSLAAQLGTFVHEFGHNLGLTHGNLFDNSEDYPFKQNLPSVMNYRYQLKGVDLDCNLVGDGVYTYSQGTLKVLSEPFVDENFGVCDNKPINLDTNTAISAGPANLNWQGRVGTDADMVDDWHDYDQWGNLRLNFTAMGSNWRSN
jgi:hypothetical protein